MIWLVDDQHLSAHLRGRPLPVRMRGGDRLFTTGYWYVRLCQALFGAADRDGMLSRRFASLPHAERQRALARVAELPVDVGLVSLRDVAPTMGRLRATHQLNVLSAEALAVSVDLGAHVLLATVSPQLEAALAREGCRYSVRAARR